MHPNELAPFIPESQHNGMKYFYKSLYESSSHKSHLPIVLCGARNERMDGQDKPFHIWMYAYARPYNIATTSTKHYLMRRFRNMRMNLIIPEIGVLLLNGGAEQLISYSCALYTVMWRNTWGAAVSFLDEAKRVVAVDVVLYHPTRVKRRNDMELIIRLLVQKDINDVSFNHVQHNWYNYVRCGSVRFGLVLNGCYCSRYVARILSSP